MAALGCDENTKTIYPTELPIGVKPGTRLSPKLLLADDGTMFLHPTIWVDSEYGECVFRTAADNKYRCLPNMATQAPPKYLDPSCIQEVFVHRAEFHCTPMGVYGLVQTPIDGCMDDTTRVLKSEKRVDVNNVYANINGTCMSWQALNPAQDTVYLLSDEVPASEFVSAWR
jgi:hypothetical protein